MACPNCFLTSQYGRPTHCGPRQPQLRLRARRVRHKESSPASLERAEYRRPGAGDHVVADIPSDHVVEFVTKTVTKGAAPVNSRIPAIPSESRHAGTESVARKGRRARLRCHRQFFFDLTAAPANVSNLPAMGIDRSWCRFRGGDDVAVELPGVGIALAGSERRLERQ